MEDMKGFCDKCPTKSICSQLCPEAELYVKQDNVPHKDELLLGYSLYARPWPDIPSPVRLTEKQAQVIALLLQGYSRKDVQAKLGYTDNYFRQILNDVRIKIRAKIDSGYEGPETHRAKEEDEEDVPWTERMELSQTEPCGRVVTDEKRRARSSGRVITQEGEDE